MTMTTGDTNNDIIQRYLREYLKASKARKGEILDHICDTTGMHRKAAMRRLRREQRRRPEETGKRGRARYYTPDVIAALKDVWAASSELCGELLHPIVAEYVRDMQYHRRWPHSDEATGKLCAMSERSIKRHLPTFRREKYGKGKAATSPSGVKELVPIFTGPWQDMPPGYGQIDTVVHCGGSLAGDMAYSVCFTDVATCWVLLAAQWNKGQRATRESVAAMRERFPITLAGIHPDTGFEFLNYFLIEWCEEKGIELSRSRAYYKNDNAHVEQKNDHVVRRFLGYQRIDMREAVTVMQELYEVLELYVNHFVPTRTCIKKVWDGTRYRPRYDRARTPYQRMLERPDHEVSAEAKAALTARHQELSPLQLKDRIDTLREKLKQTIKRRSSGD